MTRLFSFLASRLLKTGQANVHPEDEVEANQNFDSLEVTFNLLNIAGAGDVGSTGENSSLSDEGSEYSNNSNENGSDFDDVELVADSDTSENGDEPPLLFQVAVEMNRLSDFTRAVKYCHLGTTGKYGAVHTGSVYLLLGEEPHAHIEGYFVRNFSLFRARKKVLGGQVYLPMMIYCFLQIMVKEQKR